MLYTITNEANKTIYMLYSGSNYSFDPGKTVKIDFLTKPNFPSELTVVQGNTTVQTAVLDLTEQDSSNSIPNINGNVVVTNFPATQPVSGTVTLSNIPPGAATESTLNAIKVAMLSQADVVESLWADNTNGTYYYRRLVDVNGVISIIWTDTNGSTVSPTLANLKPLNSDNALTITNTFYDVTVSDTGTSIGDVLNRIIIINKAVSPPVVVGAMWINATTGLSISAPITGHYVEASRDINITGQTANIALETGGNLATLVTTGAKIQGTYNSTLPTYSTGQRTDIQTDNAGRLIVTVGTTIATQGGYVEASTTLGNPLRVAGWDGTSLRTLKTTTTGALQPPTAASGKITQTIIALSANTSTLLVAANAARIAIEIQTDGTGAVFLDRTGTALTGAAGPLVIPTGNYPLYTMPVATQTAITAYSTVAQTIRITEYIS